MIGRHFFSQSFSHSEVEDGLNTTPVEPIPGVLFIQK